MDGYVYVIFYTNLDSYNSTRRFKAVALTEEDAKSWIRYETETSSDYAKGDRYDVDFWLKYGFSIVQTRLHGA